jgi:transcriptional regulator with XRE-family HTH domain
MIKADKCQTISVTKYKEVKEYRKKAGLSQQQLADLLQVRRSTISDWEKAKCFPTPENIKKMAQIFNLDYKEFERNLQVWYAVQKLRQLDVTIDDVACMMAC